MAKTLYEMKNGEEVTVNGNAVEFLNFQCM